MSQMVHVVSIDDVMSDDGENEFQENEVSGGSLLAGDFDCGGVRINLCGCSRGDSRWKVYSAPSSAKPVDCRQNPYSRFPYHPSTGFAAPLLSSTAALRSNPPATPKSSINPPSSRAARYSPHFQNLQMTPSRDATPLS